MQDKGFFERLTLGYDANGPTFFSVKTNTGKEWRRGILKTTDSVMLQVYNQAAPWIGIQGYHNTKIKALGFIKY